MKFKILILDQFANISPYTIQQEHPRFEDLCAAALRGDFTRSNFAVRQKPEVREVDDSFRPEWGTQTFRAAKDGTAEVWMYRLDSSD